MDDRWPMPEMDPTSTFRGLRLPEKAAPVGYAALIDEFGLEVPLPRTLAAISTRHRRYTRDGWRILTPRHAPERSLAGHLVFALKYEGVDLAVLGRLFAAVGPEPLEAMVRATPSGGYARRLWFLYEWLTGSMLGLPDSGRSVSSYPKVLDDSMQYAVPGTTSSRHRVRNNLPGTRKFCPLVFRNRELEGLRRSDLQGRALRVIREVPADVVSRASAFLLLEDSRASFEIEGEQASADRIRRWGNALARAGSVEMSVPQLERLQEIVIGDFRFMRRGLRREGVFVGQHDRRTRRPLPEHIGARPEDLMDLMEGLVEFDRTYGSELDPVVHAAALSFGFVYIHPFEDGNGRLHRFLMHHALARRGFSPPGLVFPVSATILERVDEYRNVLASYSSAILPLIKWEPTEDGNVCVLGETADLYRFFDATPHARFLYGCVDRTVEEVLPREVEYLRSHDRFLMGMAGIVEMPARKIELLLEFLRRNGGSLSNRARDSEFSALTEVEAKRIESLFDECF